VIYYYTFCWFLKYFHNDTINKLNNYYNKTVYLNYEENQGIVNPTFDDTFRYNDNDVFLLENNEFNEPIQLQSSAHVPPPPHPPPIPPVDYDTFTPSFQKIE